MKFTPERAPQSVPHCLLDLSRRGFSRPAPLVATGLPGGDPLSRKSHEATRMGRGGKRPRMPQAWVAALPGRFERPARRLRERVGWKPETADSMFF